MAKALKTYFDAYRDQGGEIWAYLIDGSQLKISGDIDVGSDHVTFVPTGRAVATVLPFTAVIKVEIKLS